MTALLGIVGTLWIAFGLLAGLAMFAKGEPGSAAACIGLGVFSGLVLFALGRLIELGDILVETLAPEERAQQNPPAATKTWVRPPWEKQRG